MLVLGHREGRRGWHCHRGHRREGDVEGRPSEPLTLMMWAKYFPETRLSVLMKISRRMDSPMGLYLALNLSKRWKVLRSWQGDADVS